MNEDYVDQQLESKLAAIEANENVYEVGSVVHIRDFIIEASGLENVMFYEKINIANKAIGYVNSIHDNFVTIAVLKIYAPIHIGDVIYATNQLYTGQYSPSSIGRVIDLFGEDKLSTKKFNDLIDVAIERPTIPIMDRSAVCRPLLTGIMGIDLMFPIGKGQRQLIIGDKRTGKTQICLDTIVNQNGKNVLCFYVAIGKTKKEVKNIYMELLRRGALSYTTIITAFNDELPPVISLIPYFALSIAEDYMMQGYDVLVVIDDLKRHAEAYREISLISGKTPGRDAYPADIFHTHSRLLEKGCQHKNGGSITILPVVETKGGDITDYISTNVISITDGQIVLSAKSFQKGEKPALNYGLSVSRLGGAVQSEEMKKVGSVVRRKLLSYLETRYIYELVNTDELSLELKNQFMEGKIILNNLIQYKFSPKQPDEILAIFRDVLGEGESPSELSNRDSVDLHSSLQSGDGSKGVVGDSASTTNDADIPSNHLVSDHSLDGDFDRGLVNEALSQINDSSLPMKMEGVEENSPFEEVVDTSMKVESDSLKQDTLDDDHSSALPEDPLEEVVDTSIESEEGTLKQGALEDDHSSALPEDPLEEVVDTSMESESDSLKQVALEDDHSSVLPEDPLEEVVDTSIESEEGNLKQDTLDDDHSSAIQKDSFEEEKVVDTSTLDSARDDFTPDPFVPTIVSEDSQGESLSDNAQLEQDASESISSLENDNSSDDAKSLLGDTSSDDVNALLGISGDFDTSSLLGDTSSQDKDLI